MTKRTRQNYRRRTVRESSKNHLNIRKSKSLIAYRFRAYNRDIRYVQDARLRAPGRHGRRELLFKRIEEGCSARGCRSEPGRPADYVEAPVRQGPRDRRRPRFGEGSRQAAGKDG